MLSILAPSTHPCYSETAHRFFSRVHLPVAARCNIQCNYCNRKYDCVNESRPGVTSKLLSPEQAWQWVVKIASRRRDLSVIGIAGPGDALANPETTFRTLRLIRRTFPDVSVCLSTNGLEIVTYIDELIELGVSHLTVTINTTITQTAELIYSGVTINGTRRTDRAAITEFLSRQQQGIKAAMRAGILVKVNSLLIPGINDQELVSLAKRLRLMGVSLHNIMPLIAKPEHGSLFGKQNRPTPTHHELEAVRSSCGVIKQMAHCRQCRADAVGKLGEETIVDDDLSTGVSPWMETDYGFEKRKNWRRLVSHMLAPPSPLVFSERAARQSLSSAGKVAVCSRGTGFADQELALTREFYIYQVVNGNVMLLNVRRIEHETEADWVGLIIKSSAGCQAILSSKFGYGVFKELEARGIMPISDLSDLPVEQAVMIAIERLASGAHRLPATTTFCAEYK